MLPEGHLPFLDLSGGKRAAHLHLIRVGGSALGRALTCTSSGLQHHEQELGLRGQR